METEEVIKVVDSIYKVRLMKTPFVDLKKKKEKELISIQY